jgi:glycosyltransferase involved in cell wall biosynthesis
MTNSQLTVVMPAYNAEKTIAAAIQSVLHQSYSDFELWVLESNSKDRTAEVARSFSDPRVKVFELGSMSFQDTLAYALERAQTEWLARMDADDLSFPNRFQEQMEVVRHRPDLVLVGTQRAYLTPFGHIFEPAEKVLSKEIGRLSLRSQGSDRKFFVDASVIFKRSVALEVGGYDPEFQMGDVPLWFRLLSYGKGWEIAKPLYLYRLHPHGLMLTQFKPSDHSYRLVAKYTPEFLQSYYPGKLSWSKKPASWYKQIQWRWIAQLELLAGDRKAVYQTADLLERYGPLQTETKLIKIFTYLGRAGQIFYQWRKRHQYRHRPDWERIFTNMVGTLTLEQGTYLTND